MSKGKLTVAFLWQGLVSAASPVWLALSYQGITGHGKGFSYDLGSEADISVMIGAAALILWAAALLPVSVWLMRRLWDRKRWMAWIPLVVFAVLSAAVIAGIGFTEYLGAFGI